MNGNPGKRMRAAIIKVFLLVLITAGVLPCRAQTCSGSLGDPVINQDFGSGTNPGAPLSPGITNMTYTDSDCPEDGQYTIANTRTGNCHVQTWYQVKADHTGNPNGYMMIINASYQPSIFFVQQAPTLCPNTTYEFSAYILNLMIPSQFTASFIHPNITFSIETTSGQVLATKTTGDIPPSPYNDGPTWVKYGTFFTTPVDVSDVVVKMTNNAPGGNGNDFILDDITFRACGPVINLGFGSTGGQATTQLCEGSNIIYTLRAQVVGNGVLSYQWQLNKNNTGWIDVSPTAGQIPDSLRVGFLNATIGTYQYRLGVSNGSAITNAACRVYSPPLTINVTALPVVPPIAAQTVCEGSTLKLTAAGGASYIWTGPNIAAFSGNPLVVNNVTTANSGVYTVSVVSASGCAAPPVNAMVTVTPKVTPGISGDVAICAGETTQLSASGGLYYKWSPASGLDNDTIPNPIANPLQTTTYTVRVSNGGCSDSSRSVMVKVNQNPVANAGGNITLFEGQSVKLNGSATGDNITGYSWTPATFLDNPASLTPVCTPTNDITYTLTVASSTCGTSTSNVFVKVYKKVIVPNAFSPNNDGINDFWDIRALETYPQSTLFVYDRYGQQVFQSTGYSKPWNGTYNGSALPPGTYYYIIDLKNNTPKISGWVVIVR